jgi:hypothetical protein
MGIIRTGIAIVMAVVVAAITNPVSVRVFRTLSCLFLLCGASVAWAAAPSSQPVATVTAWQWFLANSSWLVPLIVMLLSSVATGLGDYPKAGGVVKVLRLLVSGLSLVQFKDGKGSLKLPMVPPALPPEK